MTITDWETSAAAVADGLLPFQSAFVAAICRQKHPPEIAALSVPRGNGKSWLCGGLVARSLTPGDPLFEPGVENILVSSSRNQAAITLEFARAALGEVDGYRWRADGVVHLASVLRRDGGKCQRCGGNRKLECHHVIPRTAGGLDAPSNCRTLCLTCHDSLHGP